MTVDPKVLAAGAGVLLLRDKTPPFSLDVWTHTDAPYPNLPPANLVENLRIMAARMHKLHTDGQRHGVAYDPGLTKQSAIITSAFRSPSVNQWAGGAADSEHLYGRACDYAVPDVMGWLREMRPILKTSVYGPIHQVIIYPDNGYVHIGWYLGRSQDGRAREFLNGNSGYTPI